MKVIWSKLAERRIDQIFEYICDDDPQAALRVCDKIESRVYELSAHPYIGRMGRVSGTRELVVPGLPYIAVYELKAEEIRILTIRHTSQQWPDSFA